MSAALEQPQLIAERLEPAKKVAFDTWALGAYARNHGVYVYASNLLAQFRQLSRCYGLEVQPYTCNVVENDANRLPPSDGFQPRATGLLKFNRLWRCGGACTLAAMQGVDLVFSPHWNSVYVEKLAPAVVTVHDLIPIRMPLSSKRANAQARFCLWAAAKFSRAIITGSEYSKAELLNLYGIRESKVFVVHYAYDKNVFNRVVPDPEQLWNLRKKLGITRPYIVHHGVIKPSKNLKRLIQAYRILRERNRNLDLELVLAGPLGYEYADVLEEGKRNPGLILTGALSNQELAMLVKGASLAVFPSLYEGFCLPMVEAMACGIPTIAANSSCLPEVSGRVLRYFNPESVEEMAACMEDGLENEDVRRELSERGELRARQFDWRRCGEETLKVLTNAI